MYQPKNKFEKTVWSALLVMSFRGQTGELFFHPADQDVVNAFFMNLTHPKTREFKFDEGSFKTAISQAEIVAIGDGEDKKQYPVMTLEGLRSSLAAGQTLFTGFEKDGEMLDCGLCGANFQPHKRNAFERDNGAVKLVGGDIAIVKKDAIQKFVAALLREFAEKKELFDKALEAWQTAQPASAVTASRFLTLSASPKPVEPLDPTEMVQRIGVSVDALMASHFDENTKPPELAIALPVGFACGCQKLLRATYVARESVVEALSFEGKRLEISDDRHETAQLLGRLSSVGAGPRPQTKFRSGSGASNFRDDRGRHFDRDKRPEKPRRDWNGASLQVATADALDKGGYTSLADAYAAAQNGDLIAKGIAHTGSIVAITIALERAMNAAKVVGSATGQVPATARPSASRGASVKGGKTKAKRSEYQAPRRRDEKGTPLSDLRS